MSGKYWDQFVPAVGSRPPLDRYRKLSFNGYVQRTDVADTRSALLEKAYQVRGDHITVQRVRSAVPLYARIGVDENPWIRLREGMVIRRPFEKLTVRIGNAKETASIRGGIGQAVLFASYGPLIENPPKEYGLRNGWFAVRGLTALAGSSQPIYQLIEAVLAHSTNKANTVGVGGGTVTIKNTGGSPMLVQSSVIGSSFGWAISPGETVSLQLEESMSSAAWEDLQVEGVGADTLFQVLLSSAEIDDVGIDQTTTHSPTMD